MEILKQILEDKISSSAFFVLISLYVFVLSADFVSPYHPNTRDVKASYLPPSKIYFFDSGKLVCPFVYSIKTSFNDDSLTKIIEEDKSKKYNINLFVRGEKYSVLGIFESDLHLFGLNTNEQKLYLFGTDKNGRDIFSRILYGGRPSLTIGFLGLLIIFPLGIIYGGIAGYFGSYLDNIMMRFAEAIMSLPFFYLIVVLASVLPENISNSQRFLLITIILSFVSWAGLSRIIRGQVLSIKEEDFVTSAKAIGENDFNILMKHIIPQTFSYLAVAITLSVPGFIIGESALSFLGLGINQPDPSWGNILSEGKDLSNIMIRPWILFIPAFCIFVSVLSFNLLGDKFRDILDPRR